MASFSIQPNPVDDELLLTYDGQAEADPMVAMEMYSTTGSVVMRWEGNFKFLNYEFNQRLRHLSKSLYLLRLWVEKFQLCR